MRRIIIEEVSTVISFRRLMGLCLIITNLPGRKFIPGIMESTVLNDMSLTKVAKVA